MLRGGLSLLLVPALVSVVAADARADKLDPVARSTARKLGQEALKLYDAGDYAQALDKLMTANQLVPTPTLALYAARCLFKLGRLVEASELYLDVSRMPLERGAPAVMRKALIDAVKERDALQKSIPTLEVALEGEQGDGVTVTVDDRPLLLGLLGEKRPVDPGHHKATAKRSDAEVSADVEVEEGHASRLVLKLPPLPPPPPQPVVPRTNPLHTAGWVGVGVGVAGVVLAAVSGAIAIVDDESLSSSKNCVRAVCSAAEAGTIGTYHTVTKLTTVGIVAGLAGLGVGVPVLVWTRKSDDAKPDGHIGARVEPWLSFGGAGVTGSF